MSILGAVKSCACCGRSERYLSLFTCLECRRPVCPECFHDRQQESLCTDCRDRLMAEVVGSEAGRWGNACPICGSGSLAASSFFFYRKMSPQLRHACTLKCNSCRNEINPVNLAKVSEAHRAEQVGRYEDAARLLEALNLIGAARAMRERARTSTVRNVNVDVNGLVEQLKTGGLSVPYRCGSCGASISFDSKASSGGMRFCAYCGSAINTEVLAELIRKAVE